MRMPEYKSHKTVRALEIESSGPLDVPVGSRIVNFRDKAYSPKLVEEKAFARYTPVPGDFLVEYADGYQSFSPRKAFLEGYTLVTQIRPAGSQTS